MTTTITIKTARPIRLQVSRREATTLFDAVQDQLENAFDGMDFVIDHDAREGTDSVSDIKYWARLIAHYRVLLVMLAEVSDGELTKHHATNYAQYDHLAN